MEFVEQCSHLLSSSNVGCVVKEKRLQLSDEILLEFHYKRSFAFTRLRYFAMGQKFEFRFHLDIAVRCYYRVCYRGVARIFQRGGGGGSQTGTPPGDRRLYMVYTAALPRVSGGSVVLSRHEGPY